MKSIFSGSAIVATAILLGSLIISARPSAAETFFQEQQPTTTQNNDQVKAPEEESNKAVPDAAEPKVESDEVLTLPAAPPANYVATAYSLRGRTASGRFVSKGIIAADPRVLPLGSRVRLEAGNYSGEYLVADTGGLVRGKRIDIWTPSTREALRFGRRTVKLTVLSYGGKRGRAKRPMK